MLIHPWDAAISEAEWQRWLATTDHFGILAVNHVDPADAPVLVPTHFATTPSFDAILLHLARPNPIWPHLEAATTVQLAIVGDYAFIPGYWRAAEEVPPSHGVPTSYYTALQFRCWPTIIDDDYEKAALLTTQLGTFQPEGNHAEVLPGQAPYSKLLNGIRGIHLEILKVRAKFKYDDAKPITLRESAAAHLDRRAQGLDIKAAKAQRRRTATIGEWRAFVAKRDASTPEGS
jgi:transcriptional regulator